MRFTVPIVFAAAFATAACSGDGTTEDKGARAQAAFAACAADVLKGAKIDNLTAELSNKDFRVTGSLPASKGELEWQGKKVEADISTTIIFSFIAGESTVVVSDTKRTSKVPVRPETTETPLPQDGKLQRGVNVSTVNWALHSCAAQASKPA